MPTPKNYDRDNKHPTGGNSEFLPGTRMIPDYDIECGSCGATPTVTIKDNATGEVEHLGLCGPCCFGEADMLDTKEW